MLGAHTLRTSMHHNLRNHAQEEIPKQAQRKTKTRPIVPILQHLQCIPLEIHPPVKVHLMESLHRDLGPAFVHAAILLGVEVQVVLHRPSGVACLFVLARRHARVDGPEADDDGQGGEEGEEEPGAQAAAELKGHVARHQGHDGEEVQVVEGVGARAVGGERGIFDGWVLCMERSC